MISKHTATPWHCNELIGVSQRGFALFCTKINGTSTCTHHIDDDGEFSQGDAEFIVTACNAHDDLVNAALGALGAFDALKIIGADKDLPGYSSCLAALRSALEKVGAI